jgi:hypothetical protein
MPNRYNKGNRDSNESEIREVLYRRGVQYIQMREGAGADLLVLTNPMQLWEVKNPQQPPSKRALTPVEEIMQAYCVQRGIPYRVIETPEQAAAALV